MFPRDNEEVIDIQSGGELWWGHDDGPEDDGDDQEEERRMIGIPVTPRKRSISLPAPPPDAEHKYRDVDKSASAVWDTTAAFRSNRKEYWQKPVKGYHDQGGRKRCLQLDLRVVEDRNNGESAYHLGQSLLPLTKTCMLNVLTCSCILVCYDIPSPS